MIFSSINWFTNRIILTQCIIRIVVLLNFPRFSHRQLIFSGVHLLFFWSMTGEVSYWSTKLWSFVFSISCLFSFSMFFTVSYLYKEQLVSSDLCLICLHYSSINYIELIFSYISYNFEPGRYKNSLWT